MPAGEFYRWAQQPTIAELVGRAAAAAGVSGELLTRRRRTIRERQAHRALLATIKAARECRYPLQRIGQRLGGRHHTTIMFHVRKAEQLAAGDDEFAALLDLVRGPIASAEEPGPTAGSKYHLETNP